jgi:hypothetical protein
MTVMEISQHWITARYGDRRRLGRFERYKTRTVIVGEHEAIAYALRMGVLKKTSVYFGKIATNIMAE